MMCRVYGSGQLKVSLQMQHLEILNIANKILIISRVELFAGFTTLLFRVWHTQDFLSTKTNRETPLNHPTKTYYRLDIWLWTQNEQIDSRSNKPELTVAFMY